MLRNIWKLIDWWRTMVEDCFASVEHVNSFVNRIVIINNDDYGCQPSVCEVSLNQHSISTKTYILFFHPNCEYVRYKYN